MSQQKDLSRNIQVTTVGGLEHVQLLPDNTLDCTQAEEAFVRFQSGETTEISETTETTRREAFEILVHYAQIDEHHPQCPASNDASVKKLQHFLFSSWS